MLLALYFADARRGEAQSPGEANYLTHGPTLGRLGAHQVGVWARTARAGRFSVRYGTSPKRLDQVSSIVTTHPDHDNAAWVLIGKLKADTKYYYKLELPDVEGETGRSGSFRTMPDSRELVDAKLNPRGLFNFSFEYACGNNQNPPHGLGPELPAFATMHRQLKDKIDFAILNGDWLYETRREYRVDQWLKQVEIPADQTPAHVRVAPTLVGVWENYKKFYDQAPNLRKWHADIPSFFMYDDHEMLNDIWGAGSPGIRDRRAVFRDIGARAWYDYLGWANPTTFRQPVRFGKAQLKAGSTTLFDPQADFSTLDLAQASNLHVHWGTATAGVNDNDLDGVGGVPNAGVYRIERVIDKNRLEVFPAPKADGVDSYSIGRRSYFRMRIANCDFFVTDTRGQRQMHDTRDPYKKGLSMLGKVQKKWLLEGMQSSDADFLFVVSSVNFMVPHVGGGAVRATNKDDAWTVFFDEREQLINAWDKLDKPVMLLTGDLHNSFAIKITENVWEFASGPHNSQNHIVTDEGNRPANGPFKYGPREVDIRWSTFFGEGVPRQLTRKPMFCVVKVNNVFTNRFGPDDARRVAFPKPQVILQYFDGLTGDFEYSESILAR
ncbi:MAG: alkaline phosphatase [Planctomycetaceae bacterium]|nr:alkaline phosphatase [Planctomycetaceae bacterium]